MVKRRWQFAAGFAVACIGASLFAANMYRPATDMIWEWPSFGFAAILIGAAILGGSFESGQARADDS
jgi:CDP-diglyceride synthetase